MFDHVQGAARDSECANLSRHCTADDVYVYGTANDSGSKDLLNDIDGAADNGDGIKCSADNSGSKDLLNDIDGAADNGDGIKCSADNSGGKDLLEQC